MISPDSGAVVAPASFDIDPLTLHLHDPDFYPFLLQSTACGTAQGRYDILFADPGERLILGPTGQLQGASKGGESFLEALDQAWHKEQAAACAPAPFAGGWFLLLGYELAAQVEPSLHLPDPDGLPIAAAIRTRAALVRDLERQQAWLVAEAGRDGTLQRMARDLQLAVQTAGSGTLLAGALREPPAADYLEGIAAAKAFIRAGDVFQVNLSREWLADLTPGARPGDLYARLRRTNPGPFAGLAVLDDVAVISSSPERLVSRRGDQVQTRPIAGTRPRLAAGEADEPSRESLLQNPKERAEHVMLIDLERNDLGRVCAAGSVRVDEFMALESYAHVHHIVSNVSGTLRAEVSPGELFKAVFPGGTITGCPKVRCMEIIAELEDRPRGFYTGAMGYLGRDGSLDLNILIRSIVTRADKLSFAAGSGIVADSDPVRELEEARAKAKGMLLALQ
jgi:anthranilate synthase component 1